VIALFTKKKVAVFIVLLVLVVVLDFWIFNNVKSEFTQVIENNRAELANALLLSAPSEAEKIQTWLVNNQEKHPDLHIIYIQGLPGYGDSQLYTIDEALNAFFLANERSPVFEKGIESALYDEMYLQMGFIATMILPTVWYFHRLKMKWAFRLVWVSFSLTTGNTINSTT